MLRLIVWMATLWFTLVFFTGCAEQQTPGNMMTKGQSNSTWGKKPSDQALEAEKAKPPTITATTYYTTGLLLENQGDYTGAAEKFTRAISLDNQCIPVYNHLGTCYIKLHNYEKAEETFKQAIEKDPKLAQLHNNLGFVYLLQNRYVDAEAQLRKALAIDPEFQRAHTNLAVALAKQGKTSEALVHFQKTCPVSEAYYNLGMILHSQGKLDKAEENYKLALKINPKFESAKKGLEQIKQDRISNQAKAEVN